MFYTSVVTCHPVCSLQVGDLPADEIGEDPDTLVVVVLLEDFFVPGNVELKLVVKIIDIF